ncbi:MAG: hypothetical protein ACI915_004724 [Gammaproteobacteria bacterium]|jgi:hypothetical protein
MSIANVLAICIEIRRQREARVALFHLNDSTYELW